MKTILIEDYNFMLLIWQIISILFWIAIIYLLYKIYKKVK